MIPKDQWEPLVRLLREITDASGRDDRRATVRGYKALQVFVEEQSRQRRSHPFILEALGDFTENSRKAIEIYRKALRLARRRGIESQTILLELAERHFRVRGGRATARRYLRAALEEAFRRRDRDTVKQAMQLVNEQTNGAAA